MLCTWRVAEKFHFQPRAEVEIPGHALLAKLVGLLQLLPSQLGSAPADRIADRARNLHGRSSWTTWNSKWQHHRTHQLVGEPVLVDSQFPHFLPAK